MFHTILIGLPTAQAPSSMLLVLLLVQQHLLGLTLQLTMRPTPVTSVKLPLTLMMEFTCITMGGTHGIIRAITMLHVPLHAHQHHHGPRR